MTGWGAGALLRAAEAESGLFGLMPPPCIGLDTLSGGLGLGDEGGSMMLPSGVARPVTENAASGESGAEGGCGLMEARGELFETGVLTPELLLELEAEECEFVPVPVPGENL